MIFSNISPEIIFKKALSAAYKNKFAIAFWKKPKQKFCHFVVDLSNDLKNSNLSMDKLGRGFIISPFLPTRKYYFIDAHLYYQSDENKIIFNDCPFLKNKQSFLKSFTNSPISTSYRNMNNDYIAFQEKRFLDRSQFLKLIQKSIEYIDREEFDKVVLSRYKTIDLPENFDPIASFFYLCNIYPDAFISLIYLPSKGTWIGATPETLIHVDNKQLFYTTAIAGTQLSNPSQKPSDATWTQKEIGEQALVSRYIINCFKKIRLREFIEKGPRTVVAGNLLHLKTDFTVDMKAVNFFNLAGVMLKLLHPTSAVCGMPKKNALTFINENEQYDRKFFSGYLGPVNIQNDTHLFVNLRCMEIFNNQSILYAGAGITIDSSPEKEWQEIEDKMTVIVRCLE